MAMAGRKPSERPTVTRHKPTHDWAEIPNVNYSGECPELPLSRTVLKYGEPVEVPIEKRTRNWWNALIKMPHCILWQESDWEFAVDTAMVHAMANHGAISAMAELRMREKVMGTTVDARRDLRIRYVEIEEETPQLEVVASMADRRKRLLDA
jgi:hypothetical protein